MVCASPHITARGFELRDTIRKTGIIVVRAPARGQPVVWARETDPQTDPRAGENADLVARSCP